MLQEYDKSQTILTDSDIFSQKNIKCVYLKHTQSQILSILNSANKINYKSPKFLKPFSDIHLCKKNRKKS